MIQHFSTVIRHLNVEEQKKKVCFDVAECNCEFAMILVPLGFDPPGSL